MNREILRIALPSIAANVTVPLLALVDIAITGHLGGARFIGAVTVGSMIFNMLYWLCGFLRMSTGGLTAQAYGRATDSGGNRGEMGHFLLRSLRTALVISLLFLVLQRPLVGAALWLMDATPEVEALARTYFSILIWGAPAVLSVFCLNGWFLGRQNARKPMAVAIAQNVVNIVCSLFFVVGLGWKVEGVAAGTLIAQWAGLLMYVLSPVAELPHGSEQTAVMMTIRKPLLIIYIREALRAWRQSVPNGAVGNKVQPSAQGGRLEGALFLRTLCMVAVQVWFTKAGAAQGDVVLAVNALLMQFYMLFSYVMDGFAYAGEAIGGKYFGAGDRAAFSRLTRLLFLWGVALTAVFTLVYALGGTPFLGLLTDDAAVVRAAAPYLPLACLLPLCGVATFLLDGLCVGTTSSRLMLASVASGAGVFFLVLFAGSYTALPTNNVLWTAMLAFLAVRGIVQAAGFRKMLP